MSFRLITEEYLESLDRFYRESRRVNQMTGELSYRPILDSYFSRIKNEFGSDIKSVYEPKQQDRAGRPDWRFYNSRNLGIYGYVEAKAFSEDKRINIEEYNEQVKKYLSLGYRVILTDGLEFVFFDPEDKSSKAYVLATKGASTLLKERISPDVSLIESEFRRFFQTPSARRISEQQLVTECALRAKFLSDEIESLADLRPGAGLNKAENEAISILSKLRKVVQEHHDPQLRDKTIFAAFVSQVLIFGLIYAHRILGIEKVSPIERYKKIKDFWLGERETRYTQELKPFRALTELLKKEITSIGALGIWYEDCCLMLSHVELKEEQIVTPDYHNLFERFLAAFDPKTRFDYGAFYTPKELSSYTVALAEEINGAEFKGSIYNRGNKLIDPCCGTGSFLERLLSASMRSAGEATIIGFEILPAPYALAHYRIAKIAPDNYPNIHIVLTNTLSNALEDGSSMTNIQQNLFQDEQKTACDLVRPPLTLIIGNPPSSDSSSHSEGPDFSYIQKLLDDFRPPEEIRHSRQNIQKQLQNEYVKFLRWAGNKAYKSENVIVALVLPSSFAENSSYMYARQWFVKHFDKFWILDIDKDGRTGVRSSNIFQTLQGRLLFVSIKHHSKPTNLESRFNYASIADFNLDEKNAFLEIDTDAGESMLGHYETFEVDEGNPVFRPLGKFDRGLYSTFWSLYKQNESDNQYFFSRHCSGLKLAPSSLFVHADEPILFRRSSDIANEGIDVNELITRWYKGQDRPPSPGKFSTPVRTSFRNEFVNQSDATAVLYSYRPMLNLPALISENLLKTLAKSPGGGTRYRPEILSAYSDKRTFGIAIAPSPKELGEKLDRFASFCWYLPDNDLSKRGNAHVFCNYFPEYKKGRGSWNSTPILNINPDVISAVGEESPDKVVFYIYGILCSDTYLDMFEPVLFNSAGDQPRIPMPETKQVFKEIASLGEELALLEKHVTDEEISINGRYADYLNIEGEFKLVDFVLDTENESIVLKDRTRQIEIKSVPSSVLNFRVGGYQVLYQWLKMHTYVYTRTNFTELHMKRLLSTIQSIEKQGEIIDRLNVKVKILLDALQQNYTKSHQQKR